MAGARLFRFGDAVVIALCLLLAAVSAWRLLFGMPAQTVTVTTPSEMLTFALDEPLTCDLVGRDGHRLTLCIADGACCVQEADCDDQICVHTGWLRQSGQTAACLPAGITVRVGGEQDAASDAVAR